MPRIRSNTKALVIFGTNISKRYISAGTYDTIIASTALKEQIEKAGCLFVELETLVEPGSIYEASALLEEISYCTMPNGSRISKVCVYEEYELWWTHYGSLFLYFTLPYTQYKKLLTYVTSFREVSFYEPPYKSLFMYYLEGRGSSVTVLGKSGASRSSVFPVGISLQILITLISLPILMVRRAPIMVSTGDKFEKFQSYDFRMKFLYQELWSRKLSFSECIRSLESWDTIIRKTFIRKRPLVYSEAVLAVGSFLSTVSGGNTCDDQAFGVRHFASETNPEKRFKLLVATHYLRNVSRDIWAIRIMKWIVRATGVRVTVTTAATERNFHVVLGSKLNNVPTLGILHGVASRHSTPYDFMTGFDGKKMLSVDRYGLWSEWWRTYYAKYSDAYRPEQLYVSGPMRPIEHTKISSAKTTHESIRVLFVAEQVVDPQEAMPYLRKLIDCQDIELTIKFRPYHDGFEQWLTEHEPHILKLKHVRIVKGGMQEAIQKADVVVGSRSTGVLEALLQLKTPVFFHTQKWGDYYGITESAEGDRFFAKDPADLLQKTRSVHAVGQELLVKLREQYFGDPYKNGSAWIVDNAEKLIRASSHER